MALINTTSGFNDRNAIRYPDSLGTPPFEKWILFEVKSGRHILRTQMAPAANTADRTIKSVALYLPPEAMKSTLSVTWSNDDYGAVTGAMLSAAIQTGNEMQRAGTGMMSPAGIMDLAKKVAPAVGGALATVLIDAGKDTVKAFTGADPDKVIGGLLGLAPNPRTDVFFKSVEYRSHNFSFTMTPRNIGEANAIDEILNTFQYYMLPSFGNDLPVIGAVGVDGIMFLGYPYEFEISTFTESNGSRHHITTFDRSVLQSIAIDHAAGTRVAFVDSRGDNQYYPATTSIQLTFQEVRLQGRDNNHVIWRGAGPGKQPPGYGE
jgi:hypothetical protein